MQEHLMNKNEIESRVICGHIMVDNAPLSFPLKEDLHHRIERRADTLKKVDALVHGKLSPFVEFEVKRKIMS